MRPMTLFESGESNGTVSLGDLFSTPEKILQKNELKLTDIAFLICRGGWPTAVGLPEEAALEQAFDYYDAVTNEDITKGDGVKRASERVQRLMRVYARHQGTQASVATLKEDLDMPAWNPNLQSKTAIRTTDTRYFVDAFKMILTATGEYAYRRPEDGIYIVPIGCLKQ